MVLKTRDRLLTHPRSGYTVAMIIRISLFFGAISTVLFMVMAVFYRLGDHHFADAICLIAVECLLASIGLILLQGLINFCSDFAWQCKHYFSATARAERRLQFVRLSKMSKLSLHQHKIKQLYYRAELQRQRINRKSTEKYLKRLAKLTKSGNVVT